MEFNLTLQMILSELENLYLSGGRFGQYRTLYDFLESEGHDFNIPPERKGELWKAAQRRFMSEKSRLFNDANVSEEEKRKELHGYYKSSLAAEYLLNIYKETKMMLDIKDEQGNKLSLLTFTGR